MELCACEEVFAKGKPKPGSIALQRVFCSGPDENSQEGVAKLPAFLLATGLDNA
jgi:hypothetical protein